ncbi:MAG: ABC transporter ATP-binding protein [Firmicutes bacterium]|nr:ABC transporter ATP-binding protein [Bacillota bacterium]
MAALLEVRDLRYAYGAYRAVDGVSFDLAGGELVALVGRNGAGKSTLLECLAGWRRPEGGEVRLRGRRLEEDETAYRSGVLLVPDTPPFYEELTAWEHLAFVARLRRRPEAEWQAEAERLLRGLALWEQRHGYPYAFSHGMRTKLAVAAALVARPELLLLDEPFGPLDPISAAELAEELAAYVAGSEAAGCPRSVLLSSHRLPEGVRPARLLVLEGGHLLADGSPAALGRRFGLAEEEPDADAVLRAALRAARRERP